MPLQDLTPQLRTRLNRMERGVGWFIMVATLLLLFGFGYYLYSRAQSKGWFLVKAKFFTYVNNAAGLKVGDPIVLMGFQVGLITDISAMPPRDQHNVRIGFEIHQVNQTGNPYYGYVWSQGSQVKVNSSDFLGGRSLEVTRGTNGFGIYSIHPLESLTLATVKGWPFCSVSALVPDMPWKVSTSPTVGGVLNSELACATRVSFPLVESKAVMEKDWPAACETRSGAGVEVN